MQCLFAPIKFPAPNLPRIGRISNVNDMESIRAIVAGIDKVSLNPYVMYASRNGIGVLR